MSLYQQLELKFRSFALLLFVNLCISGLIENAACVCVRVCVGGIFMEDETLFHIKSLMCMGNMT